MKIYVASSWRNIYQPAVVALLREQGHEVYDFRNPEPGNDGFRWTELGAGPAKGWDFATYRAALKHPVAERGFSLDFDAMKWADACVYVAPAGRSASLELGWSAGAGKRTAFLFPVDVPVALVDGHRVRGGACAGCGDIDGCHLPGKLVADFEPELMVKMADAILIGRAELLTWSAQP